MSLLGYLTFKGNTREVIDYYIDKLGVITKKIITFEEVIEDSVKTKYLEDLNKVANGVLETKYGTLYLADVPSSMENAFGDDKTMEINIKDNNNNQLKKLFKLLAIDGKVINPFEGLNSATVVDKYGVVWNFQ